MATPISDIMKNSESMSATELGGSLLQRQAKQNKDRLKRAKKGQKVDKALALVLAGQTVFSEAYKAREKQMDAAQTIILKNNKAEATQINNLSYLSRAMDPSVLKATETLSPAERATQILSDSRTKETFKDHLQQQINSHFRAAYGEEALKEMYNTAEYTRQVNSAIHTVVEGMLTKDENGITRIENFENALPALFADRDYDRLELLEKGVNLKPIELTAYEVANIERMRENAKAQGNLWGGMKAVFRKLSGKAEAEGNINIFKKLDDLELTNPKLSQVLDTLDLKGFVTGGATEAKIDASVNKDYGVEVTKDKHADLVASILPELQNMRLSIEDSDFVMGSNGLLSIAQDKLDFGSGVAKQRAGKSFVIEEDYTDFLGYLDDNPNIAQLYSEDVGALVLRIRDEPTYATELYRNFSDDEQEIARFGREIMKPRFQKQFAALYVARKGFKNKNRKANDWYSYIGEGNYEYSSNAIAAETGASSISMDTQTRGFAPNERYLASTPEEQQPVFDGTVRSILQKTEQQNLGKQDTQRLLDLFFSSSGGSPDGRDQVDTMLRLQRPPEDTSSEDTSPEDTRTEETSRGGNTYHVPPSTAAVLTVIRELNPDIAFLSADDINNLPKFPKLKKEAENIIYQRETDVAFRKGAVEIGTAVLGKAEQDLATNEAIEELMYYSPDLYKRYKALLKAGMTREKALQKVEESK